MNGQSRLDLNNAGAAVAIVAILAIVVGGSWWAVALGPLRSCEPIAPRELPSGAAPGRGVEGVTAGAKQLVWGSGTDRVEQVVGETFYGPERRTLLGTLHVRGQPATVYRLGPNSGDDWDLAFSWFEDGCDRTVLLALGTTPEQALDYAARY